MGLMKLRAGPGEKLYGVAVRDDGLWLVLWVRRNRSGEFFVMVPRPKEGWDPHTSYHRDGTFHAKSFGHKFQVQQRQSLTGEFRGTEHLGAYGGYGPKSVGAVCDPSAFTGVVEVHARAETPHQTRNASLCEHFLLTCSPSDDDHVAKCPRLPRPVTCTCKFGLTPVTLRCMPSSSFGSSNRLSTTQFTRNDQSAAHASLVVSESRRKTPHVHGPRRTARRALSCATITGRRLFTFIMRMSRDGDQRPNC
jgi:hypothetical protein